MAVRSGDVELLEVLLRAGACKEQKTSKGRTAEDMAGKQREILRLLERSFGEVRKSFLRLLFGISLFERY